RQQAASAIQVVVQMSRMRDGSRKVSSIAEVIGATDSGVELGEIYRFERTGVGESGRVEGRFVCTGYVPKFMERLKARGVSASLPARAPALSSASSNSVRIVSKSRNRFRP